MPYIIRKLPNKDLYKVYNKETKKVHSYATTLENAKKQVNLLLGKVEQNTKDIEGGALGTVLRLKPSATALGTVLRLKPFFNRVGSKVSLIDEIISVIPSHTTYVEPFVGGGAIFWNKTPAKKSVINDIDTNLIEGYKLLKKVPLHAKLDYIDDKSIQEKQKFVDSVNDKSSIADRLIKRFYIQTNTFNSKGIGKLYKDIKMKSRMDNLKEYKDRLKNTTILNEDYLKVIEKYDSPETFFFLDPPYESSNNVYKNTKVDYEKLNEVLKKLKGKFLLTLNDSKNIENIFKDFNQRKLKVTTTSNAIFDTKNRKELFITNYDIGKVGSGIETDKFNNQGIVSLPEFRSVKIDLPTYMYKKIRQRKGQGYKYRLVVPITSSRNISSRKQTTSLDINQKPIANPVVNIKETDDRLPRLDEFSPKDREKLQEYYSKLEQNEDKNIDEINKDTYVIKQRGKPLPCKVKPDKPKKAIAEKPKPVDLYELLKKPKSEPKQLVGKGIETKNKMFSNNKMPNSWITYVKEYASKNGMSYRDALRDPKCKAGYKKPSKKVIAGKGVIDESEFADQALLADAYNSNELGANAGKKYISL